jgi:putative resolvase
MKLTQRAREAGIHPKTARRWSHYGVSPVRAHQLTTGTILVNVPPDANGAGAALCARLVRGPEGRSGPSVRTPQRVGGESWTGGGPYGSGSRLRDHRTPAMPHAPIVGSSDLHDHCRAPRSPRAIRRGISGGRPAGAGTMRGGHRSRETTDDLVRDMADVLTAFYARLYGRRSAWSRALRGFTAAKTGGLPRQRAKTRTFRCQ